LFLQQDDKLSYAIERYWDDVAISLLKDMDKSHISPGIFYDACCKGRIDVVNAMIDMGFDAAVVTTENTGVAVGGTNVEVITAFGERKVVRVGAKSFKGEISAIYSTSGSTEHWYQPNKNKHLGATIYKDNPGTVEVLKVLLKYFNINDKWSFGRTPLVWACWQSAWGNARFLVEAGADPNIPDEYGKSPLYHALTDGTHDHVKNEDMAIFLVEHGATVTEDTLKAAKGPIYQRLMQAQKVYKEKHPQLEEK